MTYQTALMPAPSPQAGSIAVSTDRAGEIAAACGNRLLPEPTWQGDRLRTLLPGVSSGASMPLFSPWGEAGAWVVSTSVLIKRSKLLQNISLTIKPQPRQRNF